MWRFASHTHTHCFYRNVRIPPVATMICEANVADFEILGLCCRISSLFKGSFAKETYHFEEPTNRSQPIATVICEVYVADFKICVALLLERSVPMPALRMPAVPMPVPLFTDRPIFCPFLSSDPCTCPRAVLTLACPPPRGWSRVWLEVGFERWRFRVCRSSPCTGPEAEFAITCLSSSGRYRSLYRISSLL